MIGRELEFANAAVRELSNCGRVKLEYVTSGFEPYSGGQRPDVVFWPDSGPNQGCAFFVELRMPLDSSRRLPMPEVLKEHLEALDADGPNSLFFALATSQKIPDDSFREEAVANGIKILDEIESGDELVRKILKWADVPGRGVRLDSRKS